MSANNNNNNNKNKRILSNIFLQEKYLSVAFVISLLSVFQVDVPIEVPEEIDEMSATVQDEDGKTVKSTLTVDPDGLYHVR